MFILLNKVVTLDYNQFTTNFITNFCPIYIYFIVRLDDGSLSFICLLGLLLIAGIQGANARIS